MRTLEASSYICGTKKYEHYDASINKKKIMYVVEFNVKLMTVMKKLGNNGIYD